MAGVAWADGDPASDVLAAQTVFLAQDGAIPAAQQSQLLPGRPTRRSAAARSGVDVVAWLALAAGAILIAAAWTVSLRLRPPRRHDGVASSHGS